MRAIELPETVALLAALPPAADLLRRPEVATAWDSPTDLPGYTVGGVAGHLVRAVGRAEPTLEGPTPVGDEAALTDWYLMNRVAAPADLDGDFPRFLREDGERLARQGPSALAEELEAICDRLRERLAEEDADRYVAVVLTERPVPLVDYLASRLLEVVVHADDVAAGAGTESPSFGPPVIDAATGFLMRLARARSGDLAVVRALTRQDRVADPYAVLRVL